MQRVSDETKEINRHNDALVRMLKRAKTTAKLAVLTGLVTAFVYAAGAPKRW